MDMDPCDRTYRVLRPKSIWTCCNNGRILELRSHRPPSRSDYKQTLSGSINFGKHYTSSVRSYDVVNKKLGRKNTITKVPRYEAKRRRIQLQESVPFPVVIMYVLVRPVTREQQKSYEHHPSHARKLSPKALRKKLLETTL